MTNEFSLDKFLKIANASVLKAQERHRKLHLPNVYVENGKVVYEYEGKLTTQMPKDFYQNNKND